MQMVDDLTAFLIDVADQPVALLGDPLFVGKLFGDQHHVGDQRTVIIREIVGRGDLFVGNDEDMGRRLGIDVSEAGDQIVFVDDVSGGVAGNDLGEDGRHGAAAILRMEVVENSLMGLGVLSAKFTGVREILRGPGSALGSDSPVRGACLAQRLQTESSFSRVKP